MVLFHILMVPNGLDSGTLGISASFFGDSMETMSMGADLVRGVGDSAADLGR